MHPAGRGATNRSSARRRRSTRAATRRASPSGWGDVDEPSPEELLHRYLSVRDELAYRRLRGEALTLRESIVLEVLNRIVRLVMPRPERLPVDVRDAIDEVRRLRARRRSG